MVNVEVLRYLELLARKEMVGFRRADDGYLPYFVMCLAKYRFGLPVSKAFLSEHYQGFVFSKVRFKRVKAGLGFDKPVLFGLKGGDGVVGYVDLIRFYNSDLGLPLDKLDVFVERFFVPLEPFLVGRNPFVVSAVITYHYSLHFGFPKTLRDLQRVFGVSEVGMRNLSVLLRKHGSLWVKRSVSAEDFFAEVVF